MRVQDRAPLDGRAEDARRRHEAPFGDASGPGAMIDDFAQPAWAEAHETFAADVAAGLARWLRRGAKAKDETPAATPHRGKGRRPQPRTPAG